MGDERYIKQLEEQLEKMESELAEAHLYEDIVMEIAELAEKEINYPPSKESGFVTNSCESLQ